MSQKYFAVCYVTVVFQSLYKVKTYSHGNLTRVTQAYKCRNEVTMTYDDDDSSMSWSELYQLILHYELRVLSPQTNSVFM